ncbi:hypothetical protein P9273_10860 [Mesorhizobium sp. WSM4935]|nr:hypothetical protein [Mesorhizobium sp. WSM4935]MDG4875599.1 hypothetical protein [Mesorhizobium sp. WSM4935]
MVSPENRSTLFGIVLYPFVFTQFQTEGYGEVAEPKRHTLFLELP